MENLEFLLNKSARLLRWYDYNKHEQSYQTYFNKHFAALRNMGYYVVMQEVNPKSIEIYFRAINNPVYRTSGVIVNVRI